MDSIDSLLEYLEDDLRFDVESLKTFDIDILRQCRDNTTSRRNILSFLIKYIEDEQ